MNAHFHHLAPLFLSLSLTWSLNQAPEQLRTFPYAARNVLEKELAAYDEARIVTIESTLERDSRPLLFPEGKNAGEDLWRCRASTSDGQPITILFVLAAPVPGLTHNSSGPSWLTEGSYGKGSAFKVGKRFVLMGRLPVQGALRLLSGNPRSFIQGSSKFSLVDGVKDGEFGVMAAFAAEQDAVPVRGSAVKQVVYAISEQDLPGLATFARLLATAGFYDRIPRDAVDAALERSKRAVTEEGRLHFNLIAMMLGEASLEMDNRIQACKVSQWSTDFQSQTLYFARPPLGSSLASPSSRSDPPRILALLSAADSAKTREARAFALSGIDGAVPLADEPVPLFASLLEKSLQEADERSIRILLSILMRWQPEAAPETGSLKSEAQGWKAALAGMRPPE